MPFQIPELGGLQSFAFGQHNGKWLIVGGRLDGLHRRQPFAAFDVAGSNTQLIVVDPVSKQKWTAPLSMLPISMQEQLSSSNMQFYQLGKYLYVVGGYGYSATLDDHTTYKNLCAIDVPATINAIITKTSFIAHLRQITDSQFQVTGGRLDKINETLYLVGGQKFLGRYNPMGPKDGPGFEQEYTNQIRKFTLKDNGTDIVVTHLPAITDIAQLHRRDYNVTPQILPNGNEGLTAFSGVFQHTIDLPFMNSINIDNRGYAVNKGFEQYYNHYHCAHFPVYSARNKEMNTVFFGGIAQYYDSLGTLTQNNDVPFVKTIARVSRNEKGEMAEYKLPLEMPAYLGSGSEFIPAESIPRYANGVIKYDELIQDTTVIGYIYGGIKSSGANIFWINEGDHSQASSHVFKVELIKNTPKVKHQLNEQSVGTLQMKLFSSTKKGAIFVDYTLVKPSDVKVSISSAKGKKIVETVFVNQKVGENSHTLKVKSVKKGGVYMLTLETGHEKATRKIIIEP